MGGYRKIDRGGRVTSDIPTSTQHMAAVELTTSTQHMAATGAILRGYNLIIIWGV